MTKAQAITKLHKLGWNPQPEGRYSVWATNPHTGIKGLFDPRDLVRDIESGRVQQ